MGRNRNTNHNHRRSRKRKLNECTLADHVTLARENKRMKQQLIEQDAIIQDLRAENDKLPEPHTLIRELKAKNEQLTQAALDKVRMENHFGDYCRSGSRNNVVEVVQLTPTAVRLSGDLSQPLLEPAGKRRKLNNGHHQ